jgi:hypothetical protein
VSIGRQGMWAVRLDASSEPGHAPASVQWDERSEVPGYEALRRGLDEVLQALNVEGPNLAVVLLPPLAFLRCVELPPMSPGDLELALRRGARRWLPGPVPDPIAEPWMTQARRSSGDPVWVSAASGRLVQDVYRAAEELGCTLASVSSAHGAWLVAVREHTPGWDEGDQALVVRTADLAEVIVSRDGRLASYRRRPADTPREALLRLAGTAVSVFLGGDDALAGLDGSPQLSAASYAARSVAPTLVPPAVEKQWTARHLKRAVWLGAAASLLLLLTGWLELWNLDRELAATAEARADISAQVESALVERDRLLQLTGTIDGLGRIVNETPRWSALMASLARTLPEDAYVTAFRAAADSVWLRGRATNAAGIFEALREAPFLEGVRASAPIVRDGQPGERASEVFSLEARLAPDPSNAGGAP